MILQLRQAGLRFRRASLFFAARPDRTTRASEIAPTGIGFTSLPSAVDDRNGSVRVDHSGAVMGRLIAIIALLEITAACHAQTTPTEIVIRQPSVEVRGGQSSIFPITGYLRQGQSVRIQREENGWLAITPPAGSSSWIMERVLDSQPPRGQRSICRVLADDAPIQLGTAESASPLPHEVAKAKRGTMVVVLGEKTVSELRGEKTTWWRIQPVPSEVRWIAKDATAGSRQQAADSYQNPRAPLAGQPVARPSYTPVQPTVGSVIMTSGPGNLRRAAFQIDGQPAFVLEDFQGYVRVYAIAQPGLNLEPFVNRRVELFGPMVQRPEFVGRGYMSVNRLHLLR